MTDPYLTLPLDGLRLIEASAGTGKTFTLATLFTRLVVEKGLRLAQILAMTFTDAATQELRARIRERLALAVEVMARPPEADDSAEITLTRFIIDQHLANRGETAAALRARLRQAVEETDLASIFTIHGFCARVLREYALESGQPLIQPEVITNRQDLNAEIAADLWRNYSSQPEYVDVLTGLWRDPQALALDIEVLASDLPLRPERPETLVEKPDHILKAAGEQLTQAIIEHEACARQLINDAFAQKMFDGRRARRASFDQAFSQLRAGMALRHWPRGDGLHVDKLSAHRLAGFCKEGFSPPASPLFDALGQWFDADDRMRQWQHQQSILFVHQCRSQIRQRLAANKQQRRIQTPDDLIAHLAHALQGAHAEHLANRLRQHYRFALVDEFQDTDPRQWQIFRRVFSAGLFLIGDPKQAIYGFRGGDIHTYLAARTHALPAPPLAHNFRSRPSLLRAIHALYKSAGAAAFGDAGIEFIEIFPGGHCLDEDYLLEGAPAPALTLCRVDLDGTTLEAIRSAVTCACAADIHRVLSAARTGRATIKDHPVKPGDIAVLVRNHKEATLIRKALLKLGIPAVSAGKQSLFATDEALEIRLLLLALLSPSDQGRLRTALATVLLGNDAAAIAALEHRPADHDDLLHLRQLYQRSGIFAMLATVCAAQAPRLLTLLDGERRLTNTLQLAEVLQQASCERQSLPALLDWLQARIGNADANDDAQQLRLESDARCVQIVTLHKSKGLEYPLVYLPFVGLAGIPSITASHCIIHEQQERCLHWKIDKSADEWARASQQAAQEDNSEAARLLYVGLTRAKHALWLAEGDWKDFDQSRLGIMLQQRQALSAHPDITWTHANTEPLPRLPPEPAPALPPPRRPRRRIHADWWVYSFTQLAHAEGQPGPSAAAAAALGSGAEDEGGW